MASYSLEDSNFKRMVESAAKDFYDSGRTLKVEENYIRFSEPWYISVQSLGSTVFHPESRLVLLLNTEDEFHINERAYVNRHERSIQGAVFLELKRSCFFYSLLGSKNNPSSFEFPFISNLLGLYSVQFVVSGVHLSSTDAHWDFTISLIRIQPYDNFRDGSFERLIKPSVQKLAPNPEIPGPNPAPAKLEERKESECVVCFEELIKRVALVPCGHTLCDQCALELNVCPVCRTPISSYLKIFV